MPIEAGEAVRFNGHNTSRLLFIITIYAVFACILLGIVMFNLTYTHANQRRHLFVQPATLRRPRLLWLTMAFFCVVCGIPVMVAYIAVSRFHGMQAAGQRQE